MCGRFRLNLDPSVARLQESEEESIRPALSHTVPLSEALNLPQESADTKCQDKTRVLEYKDHKESPQIL
jgi:hypothetical protein